MFARLREEVISKLRLGISIKIVMIMVLFTAQQLIVLGVLPKGEKYNQKSFVQNILPLLLNAKKPFPRQKTAINFFVHTDNSMCHNGHRVVDELR
jgi:hypothetical protein